MPSSDAGPHTGGISRVSAGPCCAVSWPEVGRPTPRISAPLVRIQAPPETSPRRPARVQQLAPRPIRALADHLGMVASATSSRSRPSQTRATGLCRAARVPGELLSARARERPGLHAFFGSHRSRCRTTTTSSATAIFPSRSAHLLPGHICAGTQPHQRRDRAASAPRPAAGTLPTRSTRLRSACSSPALAAAAPSPRLASPRLPIPIRSSLPLCLTALSSARLASVPLRPRTLSFPFQPLSFGATRCCVCGFPQIKRANSSFIGQVPGGPLIQHACRAHRRASCQPCACARWLFVRAGARK
jgi:hypothetical protein